MEMRWNSAGFVAFCSKDSRAHRCIEVVMTCIQEVTLLSGFCGIDDKVKDSSPPYSSVEEILKLMKFF